MAHYRTDDLTIAAALLQLDGAASNLRSLDFTPATVPDGWRGMSVKVVTTTVDDVPVTLKTRWVDPRGDKQHEPGETVKMPRVVFELVGKWVTRSASASTEIEFNDKDWQFWLGEFHRNDGLLVGLRKVNDSINALRNLMRDRHGISSRYKMPPPSARGGGF